MTILKQLADYVVHARFSDSDRKDLSIHVMDTVTAFICGHFTSEGQQLIKLYHRLNTNDVMDNIWLNCAITRLTEMDDIHLSSCITPGSVIIPTALTLVSFDKDEDVDSAADAIIIGYELMIRLGKTIKGAEVLYKGIWPTYFCAGFGAAAVAARLLRLSEEETMHALALALTFATGGVSGGEKFPFRWFTLGQAARTGCMSVVAAAEGFSGNTEMLNEEWFVRTYGLQADCKHLLKDLGQGKMLDNVSLKPFCSAKQVIPSISGLNRIIKQGITADQMERIDVFVPSPFVSMIDHGAFNRLSSITSLPYQLALAAHHPDGLYDMERSQLLVTAEIKSFMEKIHIYADTGLTECFPEKWAARIEVLTSLGTVKEVIDESPGDPGMRLTEQELHRKIHCFLDPSIGGEAADTLINLSLNATADTPSLLKLVHEMEEMLQNVRAGIVGTNKNR